MCGVQCGQNSPSLALQNVALDWNVLICVCALQLSHKPLIVKLPLAVVRFLFPLEQNFQTEEEDITRGTPEM